MFETLENKVGSRLILPSNEKYDETRKVWNGAVNRKPGAIVVCESTDDVIAAVKFAKKNDLTISIRGGGHHVAGTAVCDDGVMIDLSKMRKVRVDNVKKLAYVQGGALLQDIDKETQKYDLAVPTGTVSETGVAGLALNGGLGYLRGKYGLTCDNLAGAKLITAEGELLEVNENNHPDLFWAIRGGGGNFGVVTEFQFQLHEVGPEVLALDVMYDYKDAKEVILKAQEFMSDAPDEISINITATTLPPAPFLPEFLHMKKVVIITGMYAGNPQAGEELIQPLRELAEPIIDGTSVISYVELQSKLDIMVENHIPVYGTSLYFKELTEETVDTLLSKIDSAPAPSVLVQLWSLHGQMNRIPSDATAFAMRDASCVLLVDMMAMHVPEELCKKWVDSVYSSLLERSHKNASYLNAIEPDKDVIKATHGKNHDRLVEVKTKYDPDNRLCHNHNIAPTRK
ncbi:FAD-binding oxidoreductase [Bacillus sp. SG-1]|uniref:FAD-binding oxidoreductase n=1 Tax=Bacillus sp. SG-1 TaxID=161544 RepID=UPI000154426C|nr:FAD-binding oxidoreductase [Bacillus sp. SG-1]EDL65037.1 FAD linked oxidase-like protein [Bacillus sp. SG-1]